MPNTKQVKVDNWGVFFLQRLKHFFNRTDYCDLTLQFQDYAQLKVHRLVLNACTEYFELLERTCDIYDDCLIMPDDLQVDVMVPIINFMYTGQLEYECRLFDKLYSTAQIMNMSVLTKLLDAQRTESTPQKTSGPIKKEVILMNTQLAKGSFNPIPSTSAGAEPKFSREFPRKRLSGRQYGPASGITKSEPAIPKIIIPVLRQPPKRPKYEKPRPTRYEVPEELENESLFETSFADISYESQPLMRSYSKEKGIEPQVKMKNVYDEASCSRKFEELQASSSTSYNRARADSSEDSKQNVLEHISEYTYPHKLKNEFSDHTQSEEDIFDTNNSTTHDQDSLFDNSANKQSEKNITPNLDHAKIISEVLKKYPHLVKSNKNIKLKIMPGFDKSSSSRQATQSIVFEPKKVRAMASPKYDTPEPDGDWSFMNKGLNQDSVARLVSLGVANVTGPWLCLICGTPGKAINFPTYNKYYRHLADVHLEKISANICEHCGYKSSKRNHLLHHLYVKHGIPPPSQYSFPKCNQCDYVALTKAFLIKHKLTHLDNREFSCNVCNSFFKTRSALLNHIQSTGHKITPDRKTTNQCVYCNKLFLREANLYTHLKLSHKELASKDGIIDNSDDDDSNNTKYDDAAYEYSNSPKAEHVSIKQEYDGKIQIISNVPIKKPSGRSSQTLLNTKLLNSDILDKVKFAPNNKYHTTSIQQPGIEISSENESLCNVASGIATSLSLSDRIVVFNDNYMIQSEQDDSTMRMSMEQSGGEAILPDLPDEYYEHSIEVPMPQQTSTSQIMNQKQNKIPYKTPQPGLKNITSHQIIVSNAQQPYKTLISSTPITFPTGISAVNTTPPLTTKYVQSQTGNVNLASSSGDTIMVLQDGDINIGQSMADSGSNIVLVYSHPIGSGDKQFVQVGQEQFTEQYSGNEVVNQDQSHELNSGTEMIISESNLVPDTMMREQWNENNLEGTQSIVKENVPEEIVDPQGIPAEIIDQQIVHGEIVDQQVVHDEIVDQQVVTGEIAGQQHVSEDIIDQQDVPVVENESVEIAMEHVPSAEGVHENVEEIDPQAHGIIVSNEEKVFDEEEIDYEEQEHQEACHEDNTDGKQTVTSDSVTESNHDPVIVSMEVDNSHTMQHEVVSESVIGNQVVEWSDDDIGSKEIQQHETVIDVPLEEHSEEMEIVEESIENIEKEVQKHMNDKVESFGTGEIQQVEETEMCAEEISGEHAEVQETNIAIEKDLNIVHEEEPMIETEEIIAEGLQSTDELEPTDEVIGVVEEQSNAEESELDNSAVTEDKDIESEDNSETTTSIDIKHKSVEKISTLLNDWDDNESQPETVSEEQETNESEPMPDPSENKSKEESDGRNGNSAPVKTANIEKIVSDWDEEEEK